MSSIVDRMWERIEPEPMSGCWIYMGHRSNGYGKLRIGGRKGTTQWAHRVMYEELIGPIPKGLQLDHLCRNRVCVRPSHLEPVTNKVNASRGTRTPLKLARKEEAA